MSGLMHGFAGCHFGYISESVVAASEAAGLIKACLPQQLQGEHKNRNKINSEHMFMAQNSIYRFLNHSDPMICLIS